MKVVQISPYAIGRHGGVQTHVKDLSGWLQSQGHEVKIICPPGPDVVGVTPIGQKKTITLHDTSFEISRASGPELSACIADLTAWGAEVVHLHTPWTPMLCWQLWRRLHLPTVATFHATLPELKGFDPAGRFLHHAAKYYDRRLARIVVPSKAPQQQWKAMGITPPPSIIPPSIDLSHWRAHHRDAATLHDFNVVHVGRLEDRKGVKILLDAWPRIADAIPNAHLTIAGSGELEADLKRFAARHQMPRVQFLPPPSDPVKHQLVANADVFAAPALGGESFGLVLIEAMAAGALPVAAANAGFSTVLQGAGQDLLVPVGDSRAMADKIIDLARHPQKQRQMRDWATNRADEFDIQAVGPEFVSLYESVLP